MTAEVEIEINDSDVIERVTGPHGDSWRASLYPLYTRDDVLEMLADNCIRRGITRINRLDGWADMKPDAATMEVAESSLEAVASTEEER